MHKPNLESTQFALMIADGLTGHVLTTEFNAYISDDKMVYFLFDDLQSVRDFIVQLNNDTYEYYIYNSNYDLVEFIDAKKWS